MREASGKMISKRSLRGSTRATVAGTLCGAWGLWSRLHERSSGGGGSGHARESIGVS